MGIEMDADKEAKENCVPVMRPILALRNSKPYNCLEVYEKNKREEIQHCGDFKYLLDYEKKILKWHERAISRPEVSRYSIPCFEIPVYLAKYYVVTKLIDKNYALQEVQKSIRLQFMGVKSLAKTREYFRKRDKEFRYEMHVTNHRQKVAKKVKRVTCESEVESIEDNQFLLYYRAVRVWESIQEQAQAKGDVTSPKGTDPKSMFPIERFTQILVDTPPLPIFATYDQLMIDVAQFKKVLHEQGKDEAIERADADMIVAPSERPALFGFPPKWRKIDRVIAEKQLYP